MTRRFTVHIDVPDDLDFPLDADAVYKGIFTPGEPCTMCERLEVKG